MESTVDNERIGPTGCWLQRNEPHAFDEHLCNTLAWYLLSENVKEVLDLGCGNGSYGRWFRQMGMYVLEIDGNPYVNVMTEGRGICRDLSQRLDVLQGVYDCVMSLEVGEHIPREHEQTFLDNVCRYANQLIVLSWAVEGQIGLGHVNCRNNDYIVEQMKQRGYVLDALDSLKLREAATVPWFKDTLMVFRRTRQ